MTNNFLAGDLRRAALAIKYYGFHNATPNFPALEVIVQEAAEDKRVTEMLQAICVIYDATLHHLMTEVGRISVKSEIIACIAHDDPDMRRAATWTVAVGSHDTDTLNAVLDDVKHPENRISQLVIYVLGLHAMLIPAATTSFGLDRMQRLVDTMVMRENGIDPEGSEQ